MIHELKILPEYFGSVLERRKTFELCENDRDFRVGDYLALNEWSKENGYTGWALLARVVYILDPNEVATCVPGYVIMGIEVVSVAETREIVGGTPICLLGREGAPANG